MEPPEVIEDYHYFGSELGTGGTGRTGRTGGEARGQKRLHGAFTGGFTAGYDNTCGSALPWQPSQDRTRKQSVEDFMDDDELEEYNKTVLATKQQYDTFGLAAKDRMERELERVAGEASGNAFIVPSIMVAPVAQGIGVRLLLRMGWRRGKALEFNHTGEIHRLMEHAKSMRDLGQDARKMLQMKDAKLEPMPNAKMDSFGLGYDPYKDGFEDFRRKNTSRGQEQSQAARRRGPGIAFGTSVVNDEDDVGILEDYVAHDAMNMSSVSGRELLDSSGKPMLRHQGPGRDRLGDRLSRDGYSFEIQEVDDEHDGPMLLLSPETLPMLSDRAEKTKDMGGTGRHDRDVNASILPGFVVADEDIHPMVYPRPHIERDFVPRIPAWVKHKSSISLPKRIVKPPTEPPPGPLRTRIDQVALQVARSGVELEALVSDQDSFVTPEDVFHEYYVWKVHRYVEMMQRGQAEHNGPARSASRTGVPPRLPIDERSRILGETQLQENRKKMEAIMATKFVRAGGSDTADAPKETIIDMSKRPPVLRRTETWVPSPLLRKRLCIQVDGEDRGARMGDSSERRSLIKAKRGKETDHSDLGAERSTETGFPQKDEDTDAILAAQAFLDSLLADPPTANLAAHGNGEDSLGSGDLSKINDEPPTFHDRPLDLFQVIFEDEEGNDNDGNNTNKFNSDVFKPVPLHPHTDGNRRPHHTHGRKKSTEQNESGLRVKEGTEGDPQRRQSPPPQPSSLPPPSDRRTLDDERIRKALRILEKEKRRKERRAEKKKEKEKRRERKERH